MVIFAVINGLTISVSSIAELLFDKKSYLKLSDEDKRMITIIEEIEMSFLEDGRDPNNINLEEIEKFIEKRISECERSGDNSGKVKYIRFKKLIRIGIDKVKNKDGR